METRKIVKSGNTSYILALPINWIRINRLENGKTVHVSENNQGDLIISAEKHKTALKNDYTTIKVDGKSDEAIWLEFMTAYVRDSSSIIFEGEEIINRTSKILDNVRFFIGLDVIEQSTKSIVVKNFFSLDKETSPQTIIKKMDIVNKASFELLKSFFQKHFANEDFFELQKLNEQNERLFILTKKSVLKLFEYPSLIKNIHSNHLQLLKERTYSQALRQISLSLLSLGNSFLFLDNTGKDVKMFQKVFAQAYKDYQEVLSAMHHKCIDDISDFIKCYPSGVSNTEKFLKNSEDPLMIQAINSLLTIYTNLHEIAHETVI